MLYLKLAADLDEVVGLVLFVPDRVEVVIWKVEPKLEELILPPSLKFHGCSVLLPGLAVAEGLDAKASFEFVTVVFPIF